MLALAPPSSAMTAPHHSTSTSLRTSRTSSPPRKTIHRTPTHTLTHSSSTPGTTSTSQSSVAGPSVRSSASVHAISSPPTRPHHHTQQNSGAIDINALPQPDFLRVLSHLLQKIASVNDKIYHSAHSSSPPTSRSDSQHHQQQQPHPPRTYLATPPPEPDDHHNHNHRNPDATPTPLFSSLTTASRASVGSPTCSLFFHARNVPTISIESYLLRILKYCPTTNEVFLSLLVYFDRMGVLAERVTKELNHAKPSMADDTEENTTAASMPLVIDSYNVHRLIIAGVTVASKFFSDVFYTNSRYAKVRVRLKRDEIRW